LTKGRASKIRGKGVPWGNILRIKLFEGRRRYYMPKKKRKCKDRQNRIETCIINGRLRQRTSGAWLGLVFEEEG
jgi:hypothetical protein